MLANEVVEQILGLAEIAQDRSADIQERRAALKMMMQLKGDDGDPNTIPERDLGWTAELLSPWRDRELAALWRLQGVDGLTLTEAVERMAKVRAERALYRNIVDDSLTRTHRLAAVRQVLDSLPVRHFFKVNGMSCDELLDRVKERADVRTWKRGEFGRPDGPAESLTRLPVARPPLTFHDLWN
jgi:hypothetical protein